MATKTDCRNAIINAYGSIERDELEDASSFCEDVSKWITDHIDGVQSFDGETELAHVKFRDWWIVRRLNPVRWFNRTDCPSEPRTISERKRRVTLKKYIAVIILSAIAGASGNYLTEFGGPTNVDRGQFTQVEQCDGCKAIRTEGMLCTQCGTAESTQKIAAPLTWQLFGVGPTLEQGWQFKDGSTIFQSDGEYVVPELIVSKTRRM